METHFHTMGVHLIAWQWKQDGNVKFYHHRLASLTVILQTSFHCLFYRSQKSQQKTKSSSCWTTQCHTSEIGCFLEKKNSNKSWLSRLTDSQILQKNKVMISSTLWSLHMTVNQSKTEFYNNSHRLTHLILHFTSSLSSQLSTTHQLKITETWSHWTINQQLWSSHLLWAKCKYFHLHSNFHSHSHCSLIKTTWFNFTHLSTMDFTPLLSSCQRLLALRC